jgi:hydroxylaminobenzene mutase
VNEPSPFAARLFKAGALLFLIGLVTGAYAGFALAGRIHLPEPGPRLALTAHMNALLGGLWLVAVGATEPRLALGAAGRKVLAATLLCATWSNWWVTVLASTLGVRGIDFSFLRPEGALDPKNDVVATLLHALVVIPALVAATTWVVGLFREKQLPS